MIAEELEAPTMENSKENLNQEQIIAIDKLKREATRFNAGVSSARRANQNWDFSLTVLSILLTLSIILLGGLTVEGDFEAGKKKYIVGLGVCGVAVQAFISAYPMRQKLNGYRTVEARAKNLMTKIESLPSKLTEEEVERKSDEIRNELCLLRMEQAKVETSSAFEDIGIVSLETALADSHLEKRAT